MKTSMRYTLLLLALVALAPLVGAGDAKPVAAPPKGERVFVAGHSFHVPIAEALAEIASGAGIDHVNAGKQAIGGSTVTMHWDLVGIRNKAKTALTAGEVDVLTVSPHTLLPDPAIDKFADLLLQHNPKGRITIQISWVPRDGALDRNFAPASRDTAKADDLRKASTSFTDKIREQVKSINARYADKLHRPVAFAVPVGEAVTLLREKVARGEVPGLTKQSDLFRDSLGHGKEPVYLLNAYCHYAVIYGKSPVGLPVPPALKRARLGENTEKINSILQEIAWQAVTTEPASGVKAAAK